MKHSWQFRLQTIFLLVFCTAVGFTVSAGWIGALEATFQVAVVIGLLQQAWQLIDWRPPATSLERELTFARQFGILWRVAISITLASCFVWLMLLTRKIIALPERHEIAFIVPLQDGLPQLCV